jgi:signal peptidase I
MATPLGWMREALLAVSLIALLVVGLWATTGSLPPMVVVESSSMMHDSEGEVGAIDPGDLVLVMSTERRTRIISMAEGLESGGQWEGWESHGKPGDVIIYKKNGGNDTPVIHRVILEAVANSTVTPTDRARQLCSEGSYDPISIDADGLAGTCVLTWDAPGTTVRNQPHINWSFPEVECPGIPHGLMVRGWDPGHAGYLTLGDNNRCDVDQGSQAYPLAGGLTDENGDRVSAVRSDWVVGVAGAEIPWLGTVKLAASSNSAQVTGHTWRMLGLAAVSLMLLTFLVEQAAERLLTGSPEVAQAAEEEDARVAQEAAKAAEKDGADAEE